MLNKKIEEIKNKYYDKKMVKEYLEKSAIKLTLPDEVIKFCEKNNISIGGDSNAVFPSNDWFLTFPRYTKNEFEVEYTTYIVISKLAKVYSILNSFEVEDRDEDRMVPDLTGDSEEAYTKQQYKLLNIIEESLGDKDYEKVPFHISDRKIEGLNFSEDVVLFGPDVTVYDLLYRDVLDVIPDD